MIYRASKLIRDLVAATWARTEAAVKALADSFGLPGDAPARLPRHVCKDLADRLAMLEALVRRMLLIIAMQLPPQQLPRSILPVRARGAATGADRSPGGQPALPGERLPALIRFQLVEPAERDPAARNMPAGVTIRSGEDTPDAAGPRPEGQSQSQSAARLIRRLKALTHVFSNDLYYILEMKYLIAEARGATTAPLPLSGTPPAVLKNLHMPAEDHDALRLLHAEAARLNLELDTT